MDSRLDLAIRQIQFARNYMLELIEDVDTSRWFEIPPGGPSHIAWQVGHLAMAEYGLTLFRQRGRQPVDTELMTSRFRKRFSRGSQPSADSEDYPPPNEIKTVLQRVHEQALSELPKFSEELLNEPVEMPFTAYPTKLGALLFCSHHEMIHAGQIGLIRRQLGMDPVR